MPDPNEVQIAKLQDAKPSGRPTSFTLGAGARRILQVGKLQFDMNFSDIVESALLEWARRHQIDRIISRMPPAGAGPKKFSGMTSEDSDDAAFDATD